MQKFRLMLTWKQHQSVFIAFLSLGFVFGIFVTQFLVLNLRGFSWCLAVALLLILVFWKKQTWMISIAVLGGVIFGLLYAAPFQSDKDVFKNYIGSKVIVEGEVLDDVDIGKKGEKQIKLGQLTLGEKRLSGTLWVSTYEKVNIKRSYKIKIEGTLSKGFGNFSASVFRANVISVTNKGNDKARDVRDSFSENIRENIPEPQASLGVGYLVGQKSSLPEDFENALRIVGLTHIVVASGYNLTILVRFARRIFAPISKYQAAVASGLMIFSFILVTGFSPSMVRAGLVAGISLAAWYYGRNVHPLVLLPLVAAITLLINPSYAWGDLGWYLSFAAFGGVMILAPLLQSYFFGDKRPGTIRQIFGETISAQIVTFPIVAYAFGTFSLFALPANLLVLPLVPFAMVFTFISGLASAFLPIFENLLSLPAQILLGYMVGVTNWFSNMPNANLEINFGILALVVVYLIIIVATVYLQIATKHDFRQDNIVE